MRILYISVISFQNPAETIHQVKECRALAVSAFISNLKGKDDGGKSNL